MGFEGEARDGNEHTEGPLERKRLQLELDTVGEEDGHVDRAFEKDGSEIFPSDGDVDVKDMASVRTNVTTVG